MPIVYAVELFLVICCLWRIGSAIAAVVNKLHQASGEEDEG